MSRSTPSLLKELTQGVHLVAIGTIRDNDLTEQGLKIRFSDTNNKHFEKIYPVSEGNMAEFDRLSVMAGIDRNKDLREDAPGCRLLITIKQVIDLSNDTSEYYICDYNKFIENTEIPSVSEDSLVEYIGKKPTMAQAAEQKAVGNTHSLPPDKLEAIAKAKAMIAGVQNKKEEPVVKPANKWEDF